MDKIELLTTRLNDRMIIEWSEDLSRLDLAYQFKSWSGLTETTVFSLPVEEAKKLLDYLKPVTLLYD